MHAAHERMKYIKHVARELISYVMHAAREMNFESLNIWKNGHTKMAHTILMAFVFFLEKKFFWIGKFFLTAFFFRKEIFFDAVFFRKENLGVAFFLEKNFFRWRFFRKVNLKFSGPRGDKFTQCGP